MQRLFRFLPRSLPRALPWLAALLCLGLLLALGSEAQTAPARAHAAAPAANSEADLRARILGFLDHTIGWQGLDKMEIESISAPNASGLRTVVVHLQKGAGEKDATYYITADGKEIIEGDVTPLTSDPFSSTRAKLDIQGAPSEGPADAPVTIVEFSDLECPYCKQEAQTLTQFAQQEPGKIRVVFKYFPLTNIHPWSMRAAEAAVCVAQQNPAQFWNFEKAVFDHQDEITPENADKRLRDFALESGAQSGPYAACLANPATGAKVEASIKNGKELGIASTPTLFINGRVIDGVVPDEQLKMLIDHEAELGKGGKIAGQQCGECKPLAPIHHP